MLHVVGLRLSFCTYLTIVVNKLKQRINAMLLDDPIFSIEPEQVNPHLSHVRPSPGLYAAYMTGEQTSIRIRHVALPWNVWNPDAVGLIQESLIPRSGYVVMNGQAILVALNADIPPSTPVKPHLALDVMIARHEGRFYVRQLRFPQLVQYLNEIPADAMSA